MSESLQPVTVRLPKKLIQRIEMTATQLGLGRGDFLRELISKAMDEPEAVATDARETADQLGDLSDLIEGMSDRLVTMGERNSRMLEGMATLAAIMATVNGRKPDEAKAWARKVFLE